MSQKSHKYGQNHKIRAKYERFFPNARIYEHTRINTGDFSTLLFQIIVNIYNQPRNAKEIYINVKASLLSTFIINKEYA